jgi:hypothetical protein
MYRVGAAAAAGLNKPTPVNKVIAVAMDAALRNVVVFIVQVSTIDCARC